MRTPGYVRNYESTIRLLAERGHSIHIVFNQLKDNLAIEKKLAKDYPNVTYSYKPLPLRGDVWKELAKIIHGSRDYLRYFYPNYASANKLRERIEERITGKFSPFNLSKFMILIMKALAKLPGTIGLDLLANFLAFVENVIPSAQKIDDFILSQKPDLILLTPLVDFLSEQVDYLKSAKYLGIKCALCVHSWDNLTNKGVVQIQPDKVFVWNQIQKVEAIELHGVNPDDIVVTGAQCYDKWFEGKPSTSREEFCRKVGLKEEQPYLLYLCSSAFIAPLEVPFIKSLIQQLRTSENGVLKDLGVMVRPHPQNIKQWKYIDLSAWDNAIVWPPGGEHPVTKESSANFYDSMYHSAAIVGVNTSAMIEAGILGKPVYTILDPLFQGTQEGTLHFRHLVNGGLLRLSNNFAEYFQQLDAMFTDGNDLYSNRINNFIKDFIRPHGLEVSCTPLLVDAIEKMEYLKPSPPQPLSSWILLLRKSLLPLARYTGKIMGVKKHSKKTMTSSDERIMKKRLSRMTKDSHPIIVGPWLSEVGFEVLYWIPFLNWVMDKYSFSPERMIIVSRGGTQPWYGDICGKYIDIFDYFSQTEYKSKNQERITDEGTQKHFALTDFDKEVVNKIKEDLNLDEVHLLHPSLMYKMFNLYWSGLQEIDIIRKFTQYKYYQPITNQDILEHLPSDYIAVKFYFSDSFPETEENRVLLTQLIQSLTTENNVVLLNTGFSIDDHRDSCIETQGRIYKVDHLMTLSNNLTIQTQVISRAKAFFGTYGGFSYLACFYGIPSVALYSQECFNPSHLDIACRACRVLKFGNFRGKVKVIIKDEDPLVHYNPEFIALNVKNFDILKNMFNLKM